MASTDDLPIAAFQHIGSVNDEQEFRKGMLALVRGLDRIAQHDVLLESTKRALTVSEGDSFQWFLGKGANEAFGGRGRPRSFPSACTTSNPQTHEIQVFHSNS